VAAIKPVLPKPCKGRLRVIRFISWGPGASWHSWDIHYGGVMCVNTLRVQMHFYIYLALLLHRCIESCMYIRMQVAWFSCLKYVCMYIYIYIHLYKYK
jgi:hypothetical protein